MNIRLLFCTLLLILVCGISVGSQINPVEIPQEISFKTPDWYAQWLSSPNNSVNPRINTPEKTVNSRNLVKTLEGVFSRFYNASTSLKRSYIFSTPAKSKSETINSQGLTLLEKYNEMLKQAGKECCFKQLFNHPIQKRASKSDKNNKEACDRAEPLEDMPLSEKDIWILPQNENEPIKVPWSIVQLTELLNRNNAEEITQDKPLKIQLFDKATIKSFIDIASLIVDIETKKDEKSSSDKAIESLKSQIVKINPRSMNQLYKLAHYLNTPEVTRILTKYMPESYMHHKDGIEDLALYIKDDLFDIPDKEEFIEVLKEANPWLMQWVSRWIQIGQPIEVETLDETEKKIASLMKQMQPNADLKEIQKGNQECLGNIVIAYSPDRKSRVIESNDENNSFYYQKLEDNIWKTDDRYVQSAQRFKMDTPFLEICMPHRLSWSPDGKTIIAVAEAGVSIWNVLDNQKLNRCQNSFLPGSFAIAWNSNSKIAAIGCGADCIFFWHTASEKIDWDNTIRLKHYNNWRAIANIVWGLNDKSLYVVRNAGVRHQFHVYTFVSLKSSLDSLSINQLMLLLMLEQLAKTEEGEIKIEEHKKIILYALNSYPQELKSAILERYKLTDEFLQHS